MVTITGGAALKAKMAEIAKRLDTVGSVNVGFLEGATYPDGTSVPMVAYVQEFGSEAQQIPPRPFFRRMIAEKSASWGKGVASAVKMADYDTGKALAIVGETVKGQLQQSIVDLTDPPLAPATIARKSAGGTSAAAHGVLGPAKPLVDTGVMLRSVAFEVNPPSSEA